METPASVETFTSYVMGLAAADIVYCDADPSDRGPLKSLSTPLPNLASLSGYLDPNEPSEWLNGYNSRMAELMADNGELATEAAQDAPG